MYSYFAVPLSVCRFWIRTVGLDFVFFPKASKRHGGEATARRGWDALMIGMVISFLHLAASGLAAGLVPFYFCKIGGIEK